MICLGLGLTFTGVRGDHSCHAKPLKHTPLFPDGDFLTGKDNGRDRRFRVQFMLRWEGKKLGDLSRFTNDLSDSLETASQNRDQGR